ncbi:MAG: PadR family transcriptional regulator [Propionibacteriaceae bacterium]|nr:PadR family transcriptional regulator [Propionibacteriaceae bacterium]
MQTTPPAAIGVAGALLDAAVLAVVAKGDTYGYALTARVRDSLDVAESTIYPVLRRLEKEGSLWCYDVPSDGRNRRYYAVTDLGRAKLEALKTQWGSFKTKIDDVFDEESK